jgi:hypothetical protein
LPTPAPPVARRHQPPIMSTPPLCTPASLVTVKKFSFYPCGAACTSDGTAIVVRRHCKGIFRCRAELASFTCNAHYCSRSATNCSCPCAEREVYGATSLATARTLTNRTLLRVLAGRHAFAPALGLTRPLFAGCAAAYLDLGTNVGERIVQARAIGSLLAYCARTAAATSRVRRSRVVQLFEPLHFPGAQRPGQRWFTAHLGNISRARTCAAGFEPNPVHRRTLRALARRHRALGRHVRIDGSHCARPLPLPLHRCSVHTDGTRVPCCVLQVRIVEAAIGANNSVMRFFSDGHSGGDYVGASLLQWSRDHATYAQNSSVMVRAKLRRACHEPRCASVA